MSDDYETPQFSVDELRVHDKEYVNPLPRRTNHHVNGFAVQGRRDMLHHYDALRAALEGLLDAVADTMRSHEKELECCSVTRVRMIEARTALALSRDAGGGR